MKTFVLIALSASALGCAGIVGIEDWGSPFGESGGVGGDAWSGSGGSSGDSSSSSPASSGTSAVSNGSTGGNGGSTSESASSSTSTASSTSSVVSSSQASSSGAGGSGGGGPPPCSPTTCAGCCDGGGICQLGTTDAFCGEGGISCAVCKNVCGWDPVGPAFCASGSGISFFSCQSHQCVPKVVDGYDGDCCLGTQQCDPVTVTCQQ